MRRLLKILLNKLHYKIRYPLHMWPCLKVNLIRWSITTYKDVAVTAGELNLGHPVALDQYLLSRVENPTTKSEGGPIFTYKGMVLDGNGRVLALQIADPERVIWVKDGIDDGGRLRRWYRRLLTGL